MYTVTKSLNNNIVMARAEDGRECVLTGSGIGFRKSPGAPVLEQQIEHIYYGLDKLQEKWLYLLGQCSPVALAVSRSILQEAERRGKLHLTPVALIIISNHLTCAMERTREHAPVSSMLQEAVMLVYPDEYQLSKKSFSLLYRKYGILIPESEAVILALCIVDATSNGCPGHLTAAQKAAEDILELVRHNCNVRDDAETLEFAAYIKLRCWLVSLGKTHHSVLEIPDEMLDILYSKIVGSRDCITAVANYLADKFQYTMQQEDILNFLLRLNRIV